MNSPDHNEDNFIIHTDGSEGVGSQRGNAISSLYIRGQYSFWRQEGLRKQDERGGGDNEKKVILSQELVSGTERAQPWLGEGGGMSRGTTCKLVCMKDLYICYS